jgi:hypothetical protein
MSQLALQWMDEMRGSNPPTHAPAKAERDHGIARAHDHAENDTPGWTEQAISLLAQYAHIHRGYPWLVEDAREYAYACGLPRESDARAWGSVTRGARKRGLIVRDGFAIGKVNLSPKPLWRAV